MLLEGKRGLVLSVTNQNSIGWAIAQKAHELGAEVGVGAQNERMMQRVGPMLEPFERMTGFMCDFSEEDQLTALAEQVAEKYGKIDFLVHSAAYADKNDLTGRFIDTSREGFKMALDISAYSLVSLCRTLEPLMNPDGSVVAMSYLGSTRAVGNYNVMGVAKAALESSVRYLSQDLGAHGIRVNTVSPGPINTVAARGVKGLLGMIDEVHNKAPLKRPFGQEEVALTTAYLLSDLSKGVTGQIIFVDSGYNVVGI
jgi:enoyl-[acyl-carrier protein] reductase I